MPSKPPNEIEPLMTQLWQLLDLAATLATAADAVDHLEQIAMLCDRAGETARAGAALLTT